MSSPLSHRLVVGLAPWVALSLFGLAAACSGSTDTSSSDTDAGGGSDGASSDTGGGSDAGGGGDTGSGDTGSDANVVCSTLVNDGPAVPVNLVTASAPAATGGSLSDGTYVLSDVTVYGSPIATTLGTAKGKIKIAGNQSELIVESSGKTTTSAGTFTVSSNTLHLTQTCPAAQTQDVKFSVVTSDAGKPTLVLQADISGKTAGESFVQQ